MHLWRWGAIGQSNNIRLWHPSPSELPGRPASLLLTTLNGLRTLWILFEPLLTCKKKKIYYHKWRQQIGAKAQLDITVWQLQLQVALWAQRKLSKFCKSTSWNDCVLIVCFQGAGNYPQNKYLIQNLRRHVRPSPVKPDPQLQVKLPTVSVQVAFAWQLSMLRSHSLMFEHVLPFPWKHSSTSNTHRHFTKQLLSLHYCKRGFGIF